MSIGHPVTNVAVRLVAATKGNIQRAEIGVQAGILNRQHVGIGSGLIVV